jgi:glycosyltransferase involved in cell wall biosynthesis
VAPVPGGPALLVASFAYEPNRRGLRFLVDEVLPRVPEARLLLVGRGLDPGTVGDRAEALGFVEDLAAVYARAACAVVPLLEGGGSPLKFVEALAYGLPVVATPRAAAGLEARAGEHFLLGEGADGFAEALRIALSGGAPGVGSAGRRLAEERYSVAALTRALAP